MHLQCYVIVSGSIFSHKILAISIQFTDPAKIVQFQPEYIVVVQQSLIINCEAEGNPPPSYTWTPCDSEKVCDKNTLGISQVLDDEHYTCRVANEFSSDVKNASVCKLL